MPARRQRARVARREQIAVRGEELSDGSVVGAAVRGRRTQVVRRARWERDPRCEKDPNAQRMKRPVLPPSAAAEANVVAPHAACAVVRVEMLCFAIRCRHATARGAKDSRSCRRNAKRRHTAPESRTLRKG